MSIDLGVLKSMVLERISYDKESGEFRYRTSKIPKYVGAIAGNLAANGYRRFRISNNDVAAHRAAFLFVTGDWPSGFVDHINGVRDDNRWCNLRLSDPKGNSRNCSVPHNSHSGIRGVSFKPVASKTRPWSARIKVDGVFMHLGTFKTKDEAVAARMEASKKYHGEFSGQIIRGECRVAEAS